MSPIIRPCGLSRFGIALAVAPVLLLIAWTHDQPKAQAATVAAPIPAPVAATPPDTSVKVSEAVRVKCNPTDSPQFDFDYTARDYLVSKGIASAEITVTSRGKLDVTGDEAAGWQLDRRVAIDERSAIAAQ